MIRAFIIQHYIVLDRKQPMLSTHNTNKILFSLQRHWGQLFQQQVINLLAYGSAAFPQTQNQQVFNNNTVDLLVQVQSAAEFHKNLLRYRATDYAGASHLLGAPFLQLASKYIFPMHSNHIEIDGRKIKYSVVERDVFRRDLRSWKYLSFAGRCHKPILFIKPATDHLDWQIERNRQMATAAALLLLPKGKRCRMQQLFHKITSISYLGDVRFVARAENPHKVSHIVEHNHEFFKEIYLPLLQKIRTQIPNHLFIQDDHLTLHQSQQSLTFLIFQLPQNIIASLAELYPGESHIIQRIADYGSGDLDSRLVEVLSAINKRSSFRMAGQNLLSGSPWNNLRYLLRKVRMGIK